MRYWQKIREIYYKVGEGYTLFTCNLEFYPNQLSQKKQLNSLHTELKNGGSAIHCILAKRRHKTTLCCLDLLIYLFQF